ncbi:hypothetical protein BGZ95_007410 [Linnemannia exigua]|uniref:Uncharacterized protein n=1 Tax=Linnemannia exigua TaxID=604196 RepID=A0AAD4DGX1_9FUNG|nr:hypothetical protein BGZ95_007410 [Linnemannia exigua]
MTRELDPDRFELLKNEYSDVRVLVSHNGDRPFMTCPEIEDFTQDQQAIFNLSESVRSIRFPCGGEDNMRQAITLGEIILDSTPSGTPALLSREEGYFSTWTHGNIALMGDACHKVM